MSQQVFTDRYQIIRHLARGGMAEVYLAQDLLLDRRVALKVLFPEFAADHSFVERFRREARSAAGLNHPNVVSIYDWGEAGGTYFIVMEYVDGRTLRDVIRSEGPLHPTRAAEIGAEIAAALAFAHRNGVIHRDVKPGNVMISNLVKVTDFGIARAGDPGESLTQTGAVMGTATYFSPEQAQGQGIDPRSDVYSLGVVLYEMLTGRPPFMGDSPVAVAYQHVRETPVPPHQHNPDVPKDLEAVVMKALAKNRANRYGSADALRGDLMRFASGQPVSAEPLMAAPVSAGTARTAVHESVDPSGEGTRMMPAARDEEYVEEEWEPVDDRHGPRTGIYIFILVMLLIILGAMLFLLARELGIGGSDDVTVPSVVGDPAETAVEKIEAAGLEPEIEAAPLDAGERGTVVAQDPAGGSSVSEGSTVTLRVAGVAEDVTIPDVRGQPLGEARALLEELGLIVRTNFQASDEIPADQVIEQDPGPGPGQTGDIITLTVSSGVDEVVVPSLFRVGEEEAAQILTDLGLRVERRTENSREVPAGSVIRSDPGASTPLRRGAVVTLVVSSGPPPTTTTTAPPTTTSPPTTTTTVPTTTTIQATTIVPTTASA